VYKKVAWAEGYICVLMLAFTGSHGYLLYARTMMHHECSKYYYLLTKRDYFPLVLFIALANIFFISYKLIELRKYNGKIKN
jgi:hypothetical protein